jgi:hypothetical protein
MAGRLDEGESAIMTSSLDSLVKQIEAGAEGPYPKFPPATKYALRNAKVTEIIGTRLEQGMVFNTIVDLGYSFYTGLQGICFEFHPAGDGILVLMDPHCRVAGMLEHFDRLQPNPLLPPVPPKVDLPFALATPINTETSITERALQAQEVQSREFFQRLALRFGDPTDLPGVPTDYTRCSWMTDSGRRCALTTNNPLSDWAPERCDDWETSVTVDEKADDSGWE